MADRRQIQIAAPSLGEEEWQALREPIETGWLTQGPKVAALEKAFAGRHGVKHASAVTSATTGLHLALAALEIGPGDEVIVPALRGSQPPMWRSIAGRRRCLLMWIASRLILTPRILLGV